MRKTLPDYMVSKSPSNASILQLYTFMVSTVSPVLSTCGPHFYVFPACFASPKGIVEPFIPLLKPSIYPPCSLSAHGFEFFTEKRDTVILKLLSSFVYPYTYLLSLPARLPAGHLSIRLESLSPMISAIMCTPGFSISLATLFHFVFAFGLTYF